MKPFTAILFVTALVITTSAQIPDQPSVPPTNDVAGTIRATTNLVTSFQILPSDTDPAIKTFDFPHTIYINRDIVVDHKPDLAPDRHELLLFIPGTHEKDTPRGGRGPVAFCNFAANLGYHVINLIYPDDIPASVCSEDPPKAFENFRMAIIQGGKTRRISVDRSESIENRLIKLLLYLDELRPRENWGQFLNSDRTIKWENIAVAGQSQGGGHAALIGIKYQVERVICTGAPKDFNHRMNAPAAWYRQTSATPKNRFFTFNHRQDETGGTSPKQLLENMKALELDAFGPPSDVDNEAFPYHHSRVLLTGYPVVNVTGSQSEGSLTAHFSMLNRKNAERWKQVWTYMLTEKPAQ